ncbi:trigger factor [Sulfuriroseicoccus oceanibius]|uniref:Trigger factor n=1 Tax=Sulfuriroseicoccus oceanibius TaxID=2707525 RepID=A0A6B3LEQ6_9BACT|nr:trigger factor [Sulfuriroseicoccus oceanibius]QQL45401.1 trigger factor [Sulfuriroseicoccus oceanibius]
MNIQVDKKPNCEAEVRVEVTAEEVKNKRSTITAGYKQHAKIPGFRPGKAPDAVVAKRFKGEIEGQLRDDLLRGGLDEAVSENKLNVLNVTQINDDQFNEDGSFSYVATVTLEPEFELPDYKNITVEVAKEEITDERIAEELDNLAERFAEYADVEDRAVAMGDIAIINYTATLDGKPLKEAEPKVTDFIAGREDHWIKMDEESFMPGFCGQLIDLEKGGKNEKVEITVADDFPLESLRGKEVIYSVEITGIKEQKLPEINDEFAAKLMPEKTLEDIKALIRENLEDQAEQARNSAIVDQVVAKLDEAVETELPEDVVARETQRRVDEMVRRGQTQGMDADAIAAQQEEILEAATTQAKVGVKSSFILEKIAEAEKIEVSDNDLMQAVAAEAQRSGKQVKKLVKEIQKNNQVGTIRHQILIGKVIDFLKKNVTVNDAPADADA